MRKYCKVFIGIFAVVYILITIVSIYELYKESVVGRVNEKEPAPNPFSKDKKKSNKWLTPWFTTAHAHQTLVFNYQAHKTVEIWGKAAIGLYLWEHILNGEVRESDNGLIKHGMLSVDGLTLIYRSGPGIIPSTVPQDVENSILVLNGRSEDKIKVAKQWLDYLPLYPKLSKVGVVLLGNEQCNNDWILPYLRSQGGRVDLLFLVYDSPLVDNEEIYQWPLGVAVYRGFPNVKEEQVDLSSSRSHICNFLGTVYENSSREIAIQMITANGYQDKCIIIGRKRWQPLETVETLKQYISALLKSDLTLSPVGMNTECYRIYEAMSFGSVPVIENMLTNGNCDNVSSSSPLRLLKQYDAPVIYVKSWLELPEILKLEEELSLEEKIERRTAVMRWYTNFKTILNKKFLNLIKKHFFQDMS